MSLLIGGVVHLLGGVVHSVINIERNFEKSPRKFKVMTFSLVVIILTQYLQN